MKVLNLLLISMISFNIFTYNGVGTDTDGTIAVDAFFVSFAVKTFQTTCVYDFGCYFVVDYIHHYTEYILFSTQYRKLNYIRNQVHMLHCYRACTLFVFF